jgi:diacylglycerol kinase family enzyme
VQVSVLKSCFPSVFKSALIRFIRVHPRPIPSSDRLSNLVKAVVLLNEKSGACVAGASLVNAGTIGTALREAAIDAEVRCVPGQDLELEAKTAVAGGVEAVIAGGGDGSISAVAAALAGTDTPLGVLPTGTLNHFAKDLGLPLDLASAVRVIAEGNIARVDVGTLNSRVFINNSSLGVYARAVIERDHTQNRLGWGKWPAMALAALRTFQIAPMLHVKLETKGQQVHLKTPLLFVGNNRYRLELPKVGSRDRLDEQILSLYVATAHTRWGMLKLLLRAAVGRLRESRDLEAMYPPDVWIESRHRRLHVAVDGEVLRLAPPLHYQIWPGALKVFVPKIGSANEAPDSARG